MRRNRTDKSSWKFRRVGSFVELEVLSTKMMSSFDLCQVLTRVKFCYRRIAAAEFYIWTIAWDTKISLTMRANLRDKRTNLRDNGKNWVDVAYGVWGAAAFLGICVLKLWEAAPSCCGCVLIVDAYSFVPPPAAVILPFSSSWSKNRCISNC